MIPIISVIILFVLLLVASIIDIRTTEIPDWISFGFFYFAIFYRILLFIFDGNVSTILSGFYGFLFTFLLSVILFYLGQWGGADAKLLIGIGILIGLEFNLNADLFQFIINSLLGGAAFSIIFITVLTWNKAKEFFVEYRRNLEVFKTHRKQILFLFFIVVVAFFTPMDLYIKFSFFALFASLFLLFHVYLLIQAIEKSVLLVMKKPSELMEGDWIVKDVVDAKTKKIICKKERTGIELKKIKFLKKNYPNKKILVRNGVPFIPSFFIGLLITVFFNDWVLIFVRTALI